MNGIQIFNSPQFGEIRTAMSESNEPLFCLSDVAKALGYANAAKAVIDHCKGVTVLGTPTQNQHGAVVIQQMKFGKESEVFRLTMKSKLPDAEKFQDWVCEEVLPSIRKNGGYLATTQEDTYDTIMAKALLLADAKIKEKENAIERLSETNQLQHHQLVISAPKVEYYDNAMNSDCTYSTTLIAKDLGMSALELNRYLKALGIQFRSGNTWVLSAKYQGKEYTRIFPRYFTHSDGRQGNNPQMRWTERGREFILKLRQEGRL